MSVGMLDTMIDVARQDERSPIARRHVDIFNAWRNGYLTQEEMDRVCFCDLEKQKLTGKLRTNRYIPGVSDSATDEQVNSWRRAECDNNSDKEWLESLAKFKKAHGLAMNKKEAQWYMYLRDGIIGDEVAAYLAIYSAKLEQQEERG